MARSHCAQCKCAWCGPRGAALECLDAPPSLSRFPQYVWGQAAVCRRAWRPVAGAAGPAHDDPTLCRPPSYALPKRMEIASEQHYGKVSVGFNGSNQTRAPKRQDLTCNLLEALKGLILEGEIVPGTRLPSERVLAKRFGVARPSLRQALKVLDAMGIVHPRVGDGNYVDERPESILREPVEFLMLLNQIPLADFCSRLACSWSGLWRRARLRGQPHGILLRLNKRSKG